LGRRRGHLARSTGRWPQLGYHALGDGAVYCFADFMSGNGRPRGDWRDYFSGVGKPIDDVLAQAGQITGTPITEVDQPYAFLGRTVLVGDAAHAMSPSMAQGVALTVEDALVLAETLSSLPVEKAPPAYEERRAPRIAWVRAQAHRRDSARGLTPGRTGQGVAADRTPDGSCRPAIAAGHAVTGAPNRA
jgi:2-polyprenyl-6-methoxyphenol hydroxylase-like FAD-dependent oxidoreductase